MNEHFKQYFWCDSLLLAQPRVIQISLHSLNYYLVQSYQVNGSGGPKYGTVIVPDVNVTDEPNFLVSLANAIATKENLDEIVLFNTCAVERVFSSSSRTKYTRESFKENYLGRFIIKE
jgi:hypothetical protein